MHFISEIRHNPATGLDERYYRIKESFLDLIGRNHSRILLNMGFIAPDPGPEDIRDIGRCLNWLQSHRNEQDLFGDAMSRYKDFVRRKARGQGHREVSLHIEVLCHRLCTRRK